MMDPAALPPGWDDLPASTRPAFQALWEQNRALTGQVAQLQGEVNALRRQAEDPPGRAISLDWFFRPWMVLALSLGAALAFAALVILDHELSLSGDRHRFFLFYMVPIAAPFAAFLLDRASRRAEISPWQWAVDLLVLALSFARAFYSLPFISGHAMFLVYALLTTRSRVAQALAVIILGEVVYFKVFAWHDPTLIGGMLAATVAAGLHYLGRKKPIPPKSDAQTA